MFFRKIEKILNDYYQNKEDNIPIITGARQIGKSFIIRETAKKSFKHYVEINLQDDFDGDKLFSKIKTIRDFYFALTALYGNQLNNVDDTIVFLDEIQVYPNLISMLKPLKADNRYRYIASGSLLGVTLKHQFIPMGSIQEVKMYPMDFEEFLLASGVNKDSIDYLRECYQKRIVASETIHDIFLRKFKEYLICGGLPQAVKEFLKDNIYKTREIQSSIYKYYKDDATKYDVEHNLKIRTIYDFLPSYMENKVKRVKCSQIEGKKTRFEKYQDEFDYLTNSGISLPVKAASNPKFPLVESSTKNLIKLYYNDVGILTNILYDNNINAILNEDYGINLGSVYETVCATELISHGHELYYFDSKKVGEVDFLLNDYESLSILPIEIKSGNDQNNFRAIPKLVKEPYNLKIGYIFGNDNIIEEKENLVTFPIYMIMFI
jgi:uncharacterized protein